MQSFRTPLNATESFALAPMEGVTDPVVRALFASLGGVDYCVTEFVRVAQEVLSLRTLRDACPELQSGSRTERDVPVHVQLLGGDPTRMALSAQVAFEAGASVIDLNFGCPAPTVNRHDGGATLLRDPRRVEQVTAAVRNAVPSSVVVSAKVRLGWDDPDAIEDIARAAEAGGAAWLTVHGRTRKQGYAPPADWIRIGRARAVLRIPVVANGDLYTPDDVDRCRVESGCSHFMMGRGALARPELFQVLSRRTSWWTAAQRAALLEHYLDRALKFTEGRERGALGRTKQWSRTMADAGAVPRELFDTLKRVETAHDAYRVLRDFRADATLPVMSVDDRSQTAIRPAPYVPTAPR